MLRRESEIRDAKSRRLLWWAVAFATVVSLASALLLLRGLGMSGMYVGPLTVIEWVALSIVNASMVILLCRNQLSFAWRVLVVSVRASVALIAAVLAAAAAIPWIFQADVGAVRATAAHEVSDWDTLVHRLKEERAEKSRLLQAPPPAAQRNAEVIYLREQLTRTRENIEQARLAELCEYDGTCGTGRPGAGDRYRARRAHREDLERQANVFDSQLTTLMTSIQAQGDDLARRQEVARERTSEIDGELSERGPRPSEMGRRKALFEAVEPKQGWMLLIWFGVFAAFFTVDLWPLRMALRVRRPPTEAPENESFVQDVIKQRQEDKEKRAFLRRKAEVGAQPINGHVPGQSAPEVGD